MLNKKYQFFISLLVLVVFVFSFLYIIIHIPAFLSNLPVALETRSPMLSLVFELKDEVSKQSDEVRKLKIETALMKESLDTSKIELLKINKDIDETNTNDLRKYGISNLFKGQPSGSIVSKMVNQLDFDSEWIERGIEALHLGSNIRHRKHWELSYIFHIMEHRNLSADNKGAVFGEIYESLTPYFVSKGIQITAIEDSGVPHRWERDSATKKILRMRPKWMDKSIDERKFLSLVRYKSADMASLPSYILSRQFDFIWSTGAIERLKSVEGGQSFIMDSIKMINPGGVGMYGLEISLDATETLGDEEEPVLWRMKDVIHLRNELCKKGYRVKKLDFGIGTGYYDTHPDKPPYRNMAPGHIKLHLNGHICTTFMLVVEVPEVYVATSYQCD